MASCVHCGQQIAAPSIGTSASCEWCAQALGLAATNKWSLSVPLRLASTLLSFAMSWTDFDFWGVCPLGFRSGSAFLLVAKDSRFLDVSRLYRLLPISTADLVEVPRATVAAVMSRLGPLSPLALLPFSVLSGEPIVPGMVTKWTRSFATTRRALPLWRNRDMTLGIAHPAESHLDEAEALALLGGSAVQRIPVSDAAFNQGLSLPWGEPLKFEA